MLSPWGGGGAGWLRGGSHLVGHFSAALGVRQGEVVIASEALGLV